MSARTIRKRVEVLRLIYEWALHLGLVYENPARYSQTPKIREELPKAADGAKIREYLDKPMRTAEDLQVHFLLSLILETGLRIGEALAVRGEDVDRENRSIRVRGKGAKERIVFYGHLTALHDIQDSRQVLSSHTSARSPAHVRLRTAGQGHEHENALDTDGTRARVDYGNIRQSERGDARARVSINQQLTT